MQHDLPYRGWLNLLRRVRDMIFLSCFQVETEMFRKLDVLVEGGKGDEDYKELFQKTLVHVIPHYILIG